MGSNGSALRFRRGWQWRAIPTTSRRAITSRAGGKHGMVAGERRRQDRASAVGGRVGGHVAPCPRRDRAAPGRRDGTSHHRGRWARGSSDVRQPDHRRRYTATSSDRRPRRSVSVQERSRQVSASCGFVPFQRVAADRLFARTTLRSHRGSREIRGLKNLIRQVRVPLDRWTSELLRPASTPPVREMIPPVIPQEVPNQTRILRFSCPAMLLDGSCSLDSRLSRVSPKRLSVRSRRDSGRVAAGRRPHRCM